MLFKAVLGTDVQFLVIPSCHLEWGGLGCMCILHILWDTPLGYAHRIYKLEASKSPTEKAGEREEPYC